MKKSDLSFDRISLPALLWTVALASQAQTVTTLATFTGAKRGISQSRACPGNRRQLLRHHRGRKT